MDVVKIRSDKIILKIIQMSQQKDNSNQTIFINNNPNHKNVCHIILILIVKQIYECKDPASMAASCQNQARVAEPGPE